MPIVDGFVMTTTTTITTTTTTLQRSQQQQQQQQQLQRQRLVASGGSRTQVVSTIQQPPSTATPRCRTSFSTSSFGLVTLFMTPSPKQGDDDDKDEFWNQQRALLREMTRKTETSLKQEQKQQFRMVQSRLLQETVFVTCMIVSLLWLICENPFVPFSYLFGAVFGLAYTYGLGKYVETLGTTVDDVLEGTETNTNNNHIPGAGIGQARFAFLILLFVLVGKLRSTSSSNYGLLELPSIVGFFTYQIASLTQGLREE